MMRRMAGKAASRSPAMTAKANSPPAPSRMCTAVVMWAGVGIIIAVPLLAGVWYDAGMFRQLVGTVFVDVSITIGRIGRENERNCGSQGQREAH